MSFEKCPDAIDLSHHLSQVARARKTSPLKGLQKYAKQPGIINLAGGLPHPDYFPFSSVGADALVSESFPLEIPKRLSPLSWLWNIFLGPKEKTKTTPLRIPKYPTKPGDLSLSTLLQYSLASGAPQLHHIIEEFTHKVYKPAYKNYATLLHTGNTDGWSRAIMTLCNPGEGVLASEWTYPSAMAMMLPHGVKPVPIPMDGQGMRSDKLRSLLSEWDEAAHGMPRPRVMYTVPIGQNPTGIITEAARKKEIYDICVEFDVIIVEDDPYYFLQEGPYVIPAERVNPENDISCIDDEEYISQLAPSYLRFDYQGRVIRLDTFSKTIAPGCRLGWFTCNPIFAEKFERQGEVSTQAPCGFSQGFVTSLLLEWGYKGYMRWLKALRIQYKQRRDFFIDCLYEEFHIEIAQNIPGLWEGCNVYLASHKVESGDSSVEKVSSSSKPIFSFVPPVGGMFVWIKLHFDHHPSFPVTENEALEMKLWEALAEAGILFSPGSFFAADAEADHSQSVGHFRVSFSNAEFNDMKKTVVTFASVLKKFYKEL